MCSQKPILLSELPLPDFDLAETLEAEQQPRQEISYHTDAGLPYISIDQLKKEAECGKTIKVFDCRFPYEFKAGHLVGAIPITTVSLIEKYYDMFLGLSKEEQGDLEPSDMIIAFHCEFSQIRGPSFASIFREIDRKRNSDNYPFLQFPNVFIIKGGFAEIYKKQPELCQGFYLPMRDQKFVENGEMKKMHSIYEREMEKFRNSKRRGFTHSKISMSLPNFRCFKKI